MKETNLPTEEKIEALRTRLLTERGERLKEERKRLGYSLHEFAKQLGIHRNTQSNYEAGREPPSSYLLAAQEAGVDIEYVIIGDLLFKEFGLSAVLWRLVSELGIDENDVRQLLQSAETSLSEVRRGEITNEAQDFPDKASEIVANWVREAFKRRALGLDAAVQGVSSKKQPD
jgi:transcriptional regulator with XRE-family HTH domain